MIVVTDLTAIDITQQLCMPVINGGGDGGALRGRLDPSAFAPTRCGKKGCPEALRRSGRTHHACVLLGQFVRLMALVTSDWRWEEKNGGMEWW